MNRTLPFAIAALALSLSSCGDSKGTPPPDLGVTDTGSADTGSADTGSADTGSADTGADQGVSLTCGDGTQDLGEQCDLGGANDDNASGQCPTTCRTNCSCPRCGDGVADFARGEECDDGNLLPSDGCGATCLAEAAVTCGNGVVDLVNAEECDDGNTASGDGCDDACQFEPVGMTCGDGNQQTLEHCDDGNVTNGDACNPTCNLGNVVTTLTTGLAGRGLAVDDTTIWLGSCSTCEISKIDIATCLGGGSCTPVRVAGGTCGALSDGPAATAGIGCTEAMTSNGQKLWFGNAHTLRELDLSLLTVTTVAGNATRCAAVDGVGLAASFHDLRGLTYSAGKVYLVDGCENVLRVFDPLSTAVTTLAGMRTPDTSVAQTGPTAYQCSTAPVCPATTPLDGYGLQARFGSPRYLTADGSGNLYVVDTNGSAIRGYNLQTDWVGTLWGGAGYVDGVGGAVRITRPRGIASDGTSVYWSEQGPSTVRQGIVASSSVSTLVGVRGCVGMTDGTGGDGTQDWSGMCGSAPAGKARLDTPLGGFAYHWRSGSIFVIESGRLRRIR